MGDYINILPTDDDPVNIEDMTIVNSIFKENIESFSSFMDKMKSPALIGALFFLITSDSIADIIKHIIPYAKSSNLSFLISRTAIFALLYFIFIER